MRRRLQYFGVLGLGLGALRWNFWGGTAYADYDYRKAQQLKPNEEIHQATIDDLADSPIMWNETPEYMLQDYDHPLSGAHFLWRWWFIMKRSIELLYIFTPTVWTIGKCWYWPTDLELQKRLFLEIFDAFQRAGCTFIKLGQWISMRPDIFPPDLCKILGDLRDHVPAHPYEFTEQRLREDLGMPLEEMFEHFPKDPIASGSIAQVYRARLKKPIGPNDITEVAVKVRHPRVLETTFVDLKILFWLVNNVLSKCTRMTMPFTQKQFTENLQRQIDLDFEAKNLESFTNNFRKDKAVRFPEVFADLCTERLLVETWEQGTIISERFEKGYDPVKDPSKQTNQQLAGRIFGAIMKMMLRDNFCHGDLHAGNVIIPENADDHVVLIDAGVATSLELKTKKTFGSFLTSITQCDAFKLAKHIIEYDRSGNVFDIDELANKIEECLTKWIDKKTGRAPDGGPLRVADMFGDLLVECSHEGVLFKGDVAAAITTMTVGEGLIRLLDEEFDILRNAIPYLAHYQWCKIQAALFQETMGKVDEFIKDVGLHTRI